MSSSELDEESLQQLYAWIDEIPLSRPKKSITRDFSDGVLVAEIVNHFIPKLADLHNYAPANGVQQKAENWKVLNRKLLSKLSYTVQDAVINDICSCKPGTIEVALYNLRKKIEVFIARRKAQELREKNQIYDEINEQCYLGPVDGINGYSYSEGPPYPVQFNGGIPSNQPRMGYGNFTGFQADGNPHENGALHDKPRYQQEDTSNQLTHQRRQQNTQYPTDQIYQAAHKLQLYQANQLQNSPSQLPHDRGSRATKEATHKPKRGRGEDKTVLPTRSHSMQDMGEVASMRISLAEKEQALLASQETVQILQVKIRRLEHLLHLKDLRLDDMNRRLVSADTNTSRPNAVAGAPTHSSSQQHGTTFRPHPPLPNITRRDTDRSERRSSQQRQ